MYEKIVIENFRCFEKLEVGPLARVNLITGANNVGKTALLEALYLLGNANVPLAFWHTNEWRGLPADIHHVAKDVRSYLLNFDPTCEAAIVTEAEDRQQGQVSLNAEDLRLQPFVPYGSQVRPRPPLPEAEQWYQPTVTLSVGDRPDEHFKPSPIPEHSASDRPWTVFLPAGEHRNMDVDAGRLKSLPKRQHEEITAICRQIEPRLLDLQIAESGPPMIYAKLEQSPQMPVPLLGEGFRRLLSMALAVASTGFSVLGHKLLLVDEIENGIYHKAMSDVWRGLARAAKQFGVQLFATTHSYECVQAAVEAFQGEEFKDDLALHRLDRLKDGKIKATTYAPDLLTRAVDFNMEVR